MTRKKRGSVDRLTISLAPGHREVLSSIAERNNSTLAFVVRYAINWFIREHKDSQLKLEFPQQ